MKGKAEWPVGAVSRGRQRAGWAAVAGCGLLAVALAPTVRSRPTPVVAPQAKIIVLDLTVDVRSPFHVAVPDGSAARMTLAGGPRLELIPRTSGDALDLEVVDVAINPVTGEETRSTVDRLRLDRGVPATFQVGTSSIAVVWVDVKTGSKRQAVTDECTQCCITCQQVTVCAWAVECICGKCCCPQCCDIEQPEACTAPAQPGAAS
jgi:hypothetical protein